MSASCPACGARVTATQKACASCFSELPWAVADGPDNERDDRPRRINIADVSYVGALPDTRPCESGVLEVSDERVAVLGGRVMDDALGVSTPGEFVLPVEQIIAATVEGPEQIEKRVTLTRLFLVGIFAFGWRKSEKRSFLVAETSDGIAIFECRSLVPLELRARLASWLGRFRELPEADVPPADDPAERLRRVTALHAEGLLTDDEFQSKRNEIISDL